MFLNTYYIKPTNVVFVIGLFIERKDPIGMLSARSSGPKLFRDFGATGAMLAADILISRSDSRNNCNARLSPFFDCSSSINI